MIEFAAEAAAARPELAAGPWVDLGTGSGALAVGLARQLPSVPQVGKGRAGWGCGRLPKASRCRLPCMAAVSY